MSELSNSLYWTHLHVCLVLSTGVVNAIISVAYVPVRSPLPSEYSLPLLFKKAVEAGSMCLEELRDVVVSLAALELMGALAELCVEDVSKWLNYYIPYIVVACGVL